VPARRGIFTAKDAKDAKKEARGGDPQALTPEWIETIGIFDLIPAIDAGVSPQRPRAMNRLPSGEKLDPVMKVARSLTESPGAWVAFILQGRRSRWRSQDDKDMVERSFLGVSATGSQPPSGKKLGSFLGGARREEKEREEPI
jgi:hypothetical protein